MSYSCTRGARFPHTNSKEDSKLETRDNDPLDLVGSNGEQISVSVRATKAQVDLLLNGQSFNPGTFTLDRAVADPTYLSAAGVYTDPNGGGTFSVRLSGSGPAVAAKTVNQAAGNDARRSFTFSIDIA